MKNQYFGDVNDYRKYGLLRGLAGEGAFRIAVGWLLTKDDSRTDGGFTDYLGKPESWRGFDSPLFDQLKDILDPLESMSDTSKRSVHWVEDRHLIPGAVFFPELLPADSAGRRDYFDRLQESATSSDLVFFDPDNGLEVPSKPYGSRGSEKYLYWRELAPIYDAGKSILVYQHFNRRKRDDFVKELVDQASSCLAGSQVFPLRTAHVLFLLIAQPQHQKYLAAKCAEIKAKWRVRLKGDQWRKQIWIDRPKSTG